MIKNKGKGAVFMADGILFVLSGPSGVGKGTVLDKLLEDYHDVKYSISATTRAPRAGEVDGEDYFFKTTEQFQKIEAENGFIESALVHNNYYGTPKEYVDQTLAKGEDIILEIDIQGARQVRKAYPDAIYIFLVPPSLEELGNRLDRRGSETPESKKIRLGNAQLELKEVHKYDYEILNDELERTVKRLKEIISKEKEARNKRRKQN